MDDQKLVNNFLSSRSEADFSALYRSKTPRQYQIALRLTSNDTFEADELIQEMWIIAIRKLDTFEWRSELKTWLTGILINRARMLRKQKEKEILLETTPDQEYVEPGIYSEMDLESAISKLPRFCTRMPANPPLPPIKVGLGISAKQIAGVDSAG